MSNNLTSKGQVTIPERIRDELQLLPGAPVELSVNAAGEVILHRPRSAIPGVKFQGVSQSMLRGRRF